MELNSIGQKIPFKKQKQCVVCFRVSNVGCRHNKPEIEFFAISLNLYGLFSGKRKQVTPHAVQVCMSCFMEMILAPLPMGDHSAQCVSVAIVNSIRSRYANAVENQ